MFPDLLNKQVVCPNIAVLQFMYPTFRVAKTTFDIKPNEPFIYVGDLKYINLVNKRTELHIVVSSTGEYDLSDLSLLIELAYKKNNKNVPKYVAELIDYWNTQKISNTAYPKEFLYCWKYLWVTGILPEKEVNDNKLFLELIKQIKNPFQLKMYYLQHVTEDNCQYIEKQLLNFMHKAMELKLTEGATKGQWYKQLQLSFKQNKNYTSNLPKAVKRLLTEGRYLTNKQLRLYNLISDITLMQGGKNG